MVNKITKELEQHVINGGFLNCKDLHDNSCEWYAFIRYFRTCKNVYKQYLVLYLVPLLIFKLKKLKNQPKKTIISTLWALFKSISFVGVYVSILTYVLCKIRNVRQKIDYFNPSLASFCCSFASIIETEERRQEINLFILPRFLETIYLLLKRRNLIISVKHFEMILFALTMGVTNIIYQNYQNVMQKNFADILYRVWKQT